MWIRFLLQPWWVRTVYYAAFVLLSVIGGLALVRLRGDRLNVPALGIVLIVVACLALAGLFAAAAGQSRNLYLEALGDTLTPAERSQAIKAAWRGPVPDDPRVRAAAGRLSALQASAYRKNRFVFLVFYPLAVVFWLWEIVDALADHQPHRALGYAILTVLMLCGLVWAWFSRRRLEARTALLAPTLHRADSRS